MPEFKQRVLEHYQPGKRGCGFRALAKRFDIDGGHNLVKYWHSIWDGTVESLQYHHAGGRPSLLSPQQQQLFAYNFVTRANRRHEPVQVDNVANNIKQATGVVVSRRRANKYTLSQGVTSKQLVAVEFGAKIY